MMRKEDTRHQFDRGNEDWRLFYPHNFIIRVSGDSMYHETPHVIWLRSLLRLNSSSFQITMTFVGGSPVAEGSSGQCRGGF